MKDIHLINETGIRQPCSPVVPCDSVPVSMLPTGQHHLAQAAYPRHKLLEHGAVHYCAVCSVQSTAVQYIEHQYSTVQ